MSVDEQRGLLVDEDDDEHAGIEPWALHKVDRGDFAREIGSGSSLASDPFSHNARAMMTKGTGHVKVLAGADGGPVLGVHIVGPRATDIIGEAQLIYNWEALPTEVAQFIHPHPTIVEAIGEAHLAAAGKALHG